METATPSLPLSEFSSALAWNCRIHRPQKFALSRLDDNPLVEFGSRAPKRLGFFEVFWVESGSGSVRNGACTHTLKSGALFFASPGQQYVWEADEFIRGEWAGFTEEFLAMGSTVGPEWLSGMPFFYDEENALLQLEPAESAEIRALFSIFRATAYNNEGGLDDIVRAHLTLILCKAKQLFARRRDNSASPAESSLLTQFRLQLSAHFPRLRTTGEYAGILGVSQAHFCAEVRRRCGLSPGQLVQQRTVLEAKRRLLHTSLTVSEIAYALEFEDPSYFVRFFKRRTGITPTRYRAAMRQDEAVS